MKKRTLDFVIKCNEHFNANYSLMKISPADGSSIGDTLPGQFVQLNVPDSKTTFLRRPISINFVDKDKNEMWLLIRNAGEGTKSLIAMQEGEILNVIFPLGGGFTIPEDTTSRLLLVGGGVGVAPMLYLGAVLKEKGYDVNFLLGARSEKDLLEADEFRKIGNLFVSTEDGSCGEKGLITYNTALQASWDFIYCCGPMPMMKAIAKYATKNNIACEVSLENKMACGIGACLCCVEDTSKGNVCVCTEGPVFNINQLKWEI